MTLINITPSTMIPKILPKGTTLEEWQQYEDECTVHETAMKYKELYFDHVCAMLKLNIAKYPNEWKSEPMLMAKAFESNMQHELSMSRSCDAPNKPGYYRANND